MEDLLTIYKIRLTGKGLYSRGRVERQRIQPGGEVRYGVNWKSNGNEWVTKKALQAHLLKCIEKRVDMTNWEKMEFTQKPSKLLSEWCDARMTMARLKN